MNGYVHTWCKCPWGQKRALDPPGARIPGSCDDISARNQTQVLCRRTLNAEPFLHPHPPLALLVFNTPSIFVKLKSKMILKNTLNSYIILLQWSILSLSFLSERLTYTLCFFSRFICIFLLMGLFYFSFWNLKWFCVDQAGIKNSLCRQGCVWIHRYIYLPLLPSAGD